MDATDERIDGRDRRDGARTVDELLLRAGVDLDELVRVGMRVTLGDACRDLLLDDEERTWIRPCDREEDDRLADREMLGRRPLDARGLRLAAMTSA